PLLRRQQLELPFRLEPAQLVEAVDPAVDRAPVREQPTEPAMVDVRHPDALRVVLHGVLSLLLRADEEHRAVAGRDVLREFVGLLEQLLRLLEVDDVDAAPLREDEAAHLGVPAPRLMAEVDPGLEEL